MSLEKLLQAHRLGDLESFFDLFSPDQVLKSSSSADLLQLDQKTLDSLYQQASMQYLKDPAQALNTFKLLVLLEPKHYEYWFSYAACCQLTKSFHKALEAYSIAALLQPHLPDPHIEASICYLHLQDFKEALKAFECGVEKKALASEEMITKIRSLLPIFE